MSGDALTVVLGLFVAVPLILAVVGRAHQDARLTCVGGILVSVALGMFVIAHHHGPYVIFSHPTAEGREAIANSTYWQLRHHILWIGAWVVGIVGALFVVSGTIGRRNSRRTEPHML